MSRTPLFRGSETMMIEENAPLYREHHITRDIEGEGAFLSEIQEGDDLRHHTFFYFFVIEIVVRLLIIGSIIYTIMKAISLFPKKDQSLSIGSVS